MSIPLSDLIHEKEKETNEAIRRQFNDEVTLINVDGMEKEFLICLLKTTIAVKNRGNYLCETSAKKIIKDHKHMIQCADQVAHFHTHNLKFPNPKVTNEQRIIAPALDNSPSVLTSANVPFCYGWSNNSNAINHSRFLLKRFEWKNTERSFYGIFQNQDDYWLNVLKTFGLMRKTQEAIQKIIKDKPLSICFPKQISEYSKQVCFPFNGEDISITPVVNHAVFVEQDRLFKEKKLKYRIIQHQLSHPSGIGNFLCAVGGKQKVFDQRPRLPKITTSFHSSRTSKNIHEFFNQYSLTKKPMAKILSSITKLKAESKESEKKDLYATFEHQIDEWLSPVDEWRRHVHLENEDNVKTYNPLISKLLHSDNLTEPGIVNELTKLLRNQLAHNKYTASYAYHYKVMSAMKPLLRRSLKNISQKKIRTNISREDVRFIYLKNIKVVKANALSNPYILGLPSLTALYGFTRKLQFNIFRDLGKRVPVEEMAWFIHDYHDYCHPAKPPLLLENDKSTKVINTIPAAQWHCDLTFDIVFPIKKSQDKNDILYEEQILSCLPNSFAGGSVFLRSDTDHKKHIALTASDLLLDELSRLTSSGRWVTPVSEKIDNFDHIAQLLNEKSTYRLANVGFQLLEKPSHKERSAYPLHAYAESAFGLVRLINPIEFRKNQMKDFMPKAFWCYQQENNLLYMKKGYPLSPTRYYI